jgi:hypothetical protein
LIAEKLLPSFLVSADQPKVGISYSFALQPAPDARQLPSCISKVNCGRLLWGFHDGDNSGFYIRMVLQAWNLHRLPLKQAATTKAINVLIFLFSFLKATAPGSGLRRKAVTESGFDSKRPRSLKRAPVFAWLVGRELDSNLPRDVGVFSAADAPIPRSVAIADRFQIRV